VSVPAARGRHGWIDALRGGAIVLVVVLHASSLPAQLSGVEAPTALVAVSAIALPFRMPLLMLLSGMLLGRALGKPPARYALGKLRTLVWPYLLWTAIYFAVVAGVETVPPWQEWIATSWLWFIFFLAVYYAVAPAIARLPAGLVPLLLWAGSAVVTDPRWTDLLLYGGYFFAGHAVWQHRASLRRWSGGGMLTVGLISAAGLALASVLRETGAAPGVPVDRDVLPLIPVTLAGIAGIALVARRVPDAWTRPLRAVGRHSVVFYVAHFPVQIAVTQLLAEQGVTAWSAHIGLGVAFGFTAGALLVVLRRHAVVDALFVLPWPPHRLLAPRRA
jgi:uncharacterized membrane protein YcfT